MFFSATKAHRKQAIKKIVSMVVAVLCGLLILVFVFGNRIHVPMVEETRTEPAEATAASTTAATTAMPTVTVASTDPSNAFVGQQPVGTASVSTKVPIRSVECSSNQPSTGKYGRSFGPEKAVDGDFNTCWMVAGEPTPADHWIKLNFWSKQRVAGIRLLNGNGWDGYYNGEKVENDLFGLNGRIREFSIIFNGGSIAMPYTAKDVREESFEQNVFRFNTPIETDYIVLLIHTAYPGSKWTTVACLSEIEAFSE